MSMEAIYQQVETEFACDCSSTVIAFRDCSNGVRQFVRQCLGCGKTTSALRKAELTVTEKALALPINEGLKERRWKDRSQRLSELRDELTAREKAEWWKKYNAYLRSPTWISKRDRVLERDNYLCQACLKRRATQVHHITYRHVFNEPLFELESVCEFCHQAITLMDRELQFAH